MVALIRILDWLWHRAAVVALGYLVGGWRGILWALVAREAVAIVWAGLARWSGVHPR